MEDKILLQQKEIAELKQSNLEKGDTVKKLGVQLARIRNDWQQQAAPKDLAPVAKARAAAEASKKDRISELEIELSQRDFREERLQQQLTLLKQQIGGHAGGGRGPISRQRKLVRPTGLRSASASTGLAGASSGSAPPSSRQASASTATEKAPQPGDDVRSLLEMVQDKDRALEEMRAQLALQEQASADAREAGEAAATAAAATAAGSGSAGASEGAVGAELRRQLKKAVFELSLLDQRYQHLDARFNTLRENHEKARLARRPTRTRVRVPTLLPCRRAPSPLSCVVADR